MESLEKLREEGMLHAKKKCHQLKMGEVDWLPDFQMVRDKLEVWNLVVHFHQGKRIKPSRIHNVSKRAGIVSPLSYSLAEAIRS